MENTKLKKEYKLPSSEEYEQAHRIPIIADKETIERLGFFGRNIKVGDVGSQLPVPNTAKEMIERFKNYDAVKLFEWEIKKIERTYGKDPTIDIIKYELEEINKFIESAKQRNLRDAFKHHDYSIYAILPVNEELEYLRLTNGFYEAKVSDSMDYCTVFHPNAMRVYGRYMLFKEWLEEKLNNIESFQNTSSVATSNKNESTGKDDADEVIPLLNTLPTQPTNMNESETKKVIYETFANIDNQGWEYAFVSEQDYNLFTDLLTNFFEYTPYTLPEKTIQLKRDCKTKIARALGEIHKELSNENKLSQDANYFKIIRILSHFKNEKQQNLYKALTR